MANKNPTDDSLETYQDLPALLRKQLVASFHDENVHGGFEKIFVKIPSELRGVRPAGQPFTL